LGWQTFTTQQKQIKFAMRGNWQTENKTKKTKTHTHTQTQTLLTKKMGFLNNYIYFLAPHICCSLGMPLQLSTVYFDINRLLPHPKKKKKLFY
jgi:hypothetical protein